MAERYAAFISYSHRDAEVAAWLQRELEGYRVPPYIVGRPGAFGAVPPRIGAVFRDREDFPASADLAASVKAALAASDSLIVICSPDAAKSRWVDAEIASFKAQGNAERVFALIVAGEPFASDIPDREAEECLPPVLRRRAGGNGTVGDQVAEPLAADLRPDRDGRRLARSKIVAGLLGIPLDMLVRREHARRQRFWAALAAASMLGTVAMGGLALEARNARDDARARRADAEQLVEFMLGDLKTRLDAVGRLDVLDAVGAQTMRYYNRQDLRSLNADELARSARALQMVGELRSMRGDFGSAEVAYRKASATTGELMAREPKNGQRMFDHAQSVFYVGDVAVKIGDRFTAKRAFDEYARLADRLIMIDPKNDAWRAEVAYSRSNRGMMAMSLRDFDAAFADFSQSAKITRSLVLKNPTSEDWMTTFADVNAWLSDCERFRGNLTAATQDSQTEINVLSSFSRAHPLNSPNSADLAWEHRALAEIAMDKGDISLALHEYKTAELIYVRLLQFEPRNVQTLRYLASTESGFAEFLMYAGRQDEADTKLLFSNRLAGKLVSINHDVPRWRDLMAINDILAGEFAYNHGSLSASRLLADKGVETLEHSSQFDLPREGLLLWLARGKTLQAKLGRDSDSLWKSVSRTLESPNGALRLDEMCLLSEAYQHLGRSAEASALLRRLRSTGYRRSAYTI